MGSQVRKARSNSFSFEEELALFCPATNLWFSTGPHAQSSILLPRDHAPHMSAVSEWSDAGWILRVPSSLAVTSQSWAAEPSGSSMVTAPLSSSARAVSAFPLDLSVIV